MIFKKNKHTFNLYNILLTLSRNKFFYEKTGLPDTFETRIYLMFIHFSLMMKIFKKKGKKFDQTQYDILFRNIEYNLRESGFGDVTVNKKMKDLNKILYDILLKIESDDNIDKFTINHSLIKKYFKELNDEKNENYTLFSLYLDKFYNFCFELPLESMIRDSIKFKL